MNRAVADIFNVLDQLRHHERARVPHVDVPHVDLPGGPVKRDERGVWRYAYGPHGGEYAPNPYAVAALDQAIGVAHGTQPQAVVAALVEFRDAYARRLRGFRSVKELLVHLRDEAEAWRSRGGGESGMSNRQTAEVFDSAADAVQRASVRPPAKKAVASKPTVKGAGDVRADREGSLAGEPAEGVGGDDAKPAKRLRPKSQPADRAGDRQPRGRAGKPDTRRTAVRTEGSEVGLGLGAGGAAGAGRDASTGRGRGRDRSLDPVFRPRTQADLAPSAVGARLLANLEALRALRRVQAEDRAATPEEQQVLARWSSWGSLPKVFDQPPNHGKVDGAGGMTWAQAQAELKSLLSPQEYVRANRTIRNAHYTDAALVAAMWDGMLAFGFDGGEVLEPGSGSGTFMGMVPDVVAADTHVTGVELDPTTAAIAQLLYPNQDVRAESFTDSRTDDGSFDAAIGNVPFSDTHFLDPEYNPGRRYNLHNAFILKALRMTRPGGLVAVITSRYTMDSRDSAARRQMAQYGDLVAAVRLPSGAHQQAAGTSVVTDVLVFRRREDGTPYEGLPFFDTSAVELDGREATVNDYFTEHPDMVLGTMRMGSGEKDAFKVQGPKDAAAGLAAALAKAADVARAKGQTQTPGHSPRPTFAATGRDAVSFGFLRAHVAANGKVTFTRTDRGGIERPYDVPAAQADELRRLLDIRDAALALRRAEADSAEDTAEITDLRRRLNAVYDDYVGTRGEDGKWRRPDGTVAYGPVSRYTVTRSARKTTGPADDEDEAIDESVRRTPPPQGGFRRDPYSALVRALEDYDETTGTAVKGDPFFKRTVTVRSPRDHADNAADALAIVMDDDGMVDLEHVAALLGISGDDAPVRAREALGNLVYDDPSTGTPVRAAEYLSGNVRQKLREAYQAEARQPGRYQANVDALQRVLPPDLAPSEIRVKFGAGWIDDTYVQDFLREILRDPSVEATHIHGNRWRITGDRKSVAATTEWGIPEADAVWIAQTLLGADPETIVVEETRKRDDGTEYTVVNQDATEKAQAKAAQMQDRFEQWVWEDPARQRDLLRVYNDRFNSLVLRDYGRPGPDGKWYRPDGTLLHLELPGLSRADGFDPHPHQYAAIERIIAEPSVGLWHVVGAGKTFVAIAGTQELRRLGLARKPAIVVPNHMLAQVTKEYQDRYPNARILGISADDLKDDKDGEKRRDVIANAALGDWDAVIITHGAFKRLPVRRETEESYLESEVAPIRRSVARLKEKLAAEIRAEHPDWTPTQIQREMDRQIEAARKAGRRDRGGSQTVKTIKDLEGQLEKLEERIRDHLTEKVETDATGKQTSKGLRRDPGLTFEDTGIDYIFYDEAHGLKNLQTSSGIDGMSLTGSDIAQDVHMKLHYLRQRYERVVTLMTATPISNSVREAYTMLRLGRPELLADMGIETFDDFAGLFGEMVTRIEVSPTGGLRRKSRFARYVNIADFLRAFQGFASTVTLEDLLDMRLPDGSPLIRIPSIKGGTPEMVSVPPSPELRDFVAELQYRAETLEYPPVKGGDNMLAITGEGRAAALDLRLVGRTTTQPSKLDVAADRIAAIFDRDKDKVYVDADGNPYGEPGSLQIVFSDIGTPTKKRKAKGAPESSRIEDEAESGLSGFNVYEALRDELVKRGVPRRKIAFIHDADTDAKKEQLFEDARTGRVAVLIGSTGKMGVGTNVQRRAVALHHLDAPWRPSDVEQREGRIVRQGNASHRYVGSTVGDPEVEVIRYVTAGSFDAYIWQAITTKAMFIAQIMRGRHDIREMEDVGEFALSAQELTAIASENPLLLHRAQALADWSKLDRMARNHEAEQRSIVGRIALSEQAIDDRREHIVTIDAALAKRTDTVKGDAFKMVVDGKLFKDRSKAAEALAARLLKVVADPSTKSVVIGEFGGFPVWAMRTGWGDRFKVGLEGVPPVGLLDWGALGVADLTGDQDRRPWDIIGELRRHIEDLPDARARAVAGIAQAQDDIKSLRQRVGAPFRVRVAGKDVDGAAAVRDAREKFERVDRELREEMTRRGEDFIDDADPEAVAAARRAKEAKALTERLDAGGGFESIGEVTRNAQADPKVAARLPDEAATSAKWGTLVANGRMVVYKDARGWTLAVPRTMRTLTTGARTKTDAASMAEVIDGLGIPLNRTGFSFTKWRSAGNRTAIEVIASALAEAGLDESGVFARQAAKAETDRRIPEWARPVITDTTVGQIARLSVPDERASKWDLQRKSWENNPDRERVLAALESTTPDDALAAATILRSYLIDGVGYETVMAYTNVINALEHDYWRRHGGRPSETIRKQFARDFTSGWGRAEKTQLRVDQLLSDADVSGDWKTAARKARSMAEELRTPDRWGGVSQANRNVAAKLDQLADRLDTFRPPKPGEPKPIDAAALAARIADEAGIRRSERPALARVLEKVIAKTTDAARANDYGKFAQVLDNPLTGAMVDALSETDGFPKEFLEEDEPGGFQHTLTDLIGQAIYEAVRSQAARAYQPTFTRDAQAVRDVLSLAGRRLPPQAGSCSVDVVPAVSFEDGGFRRSAERLRHRAAQDILGLAYRREAMSTANNTALVGEEYGPDLDDEDDDDPWNGVDEPTWEQIHRWAGHRRAFGADTHPGGEQLHRYWTVGRGREKWIHSPHRWTTLYRHLVKYMNPAKAKRVASRWFIEVVGYAAGSDLNRVHSGKPPRGKRIGPG